MISRTSSAVFVSVIALGAGGCSSESTTADVGPTGTMALSIASIGDDITPKDGACIPVTDTQESVPIYLNVKQVYLRPPGYCNRLGVVQCGHLVLTVNGKENSTSAAELINLDLTALGATPESRYADLALAITLYADAEAGRDGTKLEGSVNGSVEHKPLVVTLKVKTAKSCPGTGSGSPDAGG